MTHLGTIFDSEISLLKGCFVLFRPLACWKIAYGMRKKPVINLWALLSHFANWIHGCSLFSMWIYRWWLPWAHECSEQDLLCLWCFFHSQYGKTGLAFQQKLLCLIKGIFLTKQRLSNPKLFLYMWNEFPFHAASVHGLGPLALESSSIVKSAVYTLYMVLFRLLSSLGWGSLWLGVCAASSTMGLIRDLLCSILMKANGLMKLRGQLKPSLYHTLVGSLSSREIFAFQ